MRDRQLQCRSQAVRPLVLADVEGGNHEEDEKDAKDEETRGEEPGEVNVHENQGRGRKEKEDEGTPRRMGQEAEGGRMRSIGDPRLPSKTEVVNHCLTHVPYRNWCPHCVWGRGRDLTIDEA